MSYFRPFTHGFITQNTSHGNIMYLCRVHSASTSLGKGETVDKESNKKWHRKEGMQSKTWCPSHKIFYVLFSVTQSFFLVFSGSSDNNTVSKKTSTSKKEPTSMSEITISYLHKNIIVPLLCQCGLFIHTSDSKNSVVSKDVVFDLHICKQILFFSFYSFFVKFRE